MTGPYYTLAHWAVKPGQEDAFIAAWEALGDVFSALPASPSEGFLVRSLQDPSSFYSFGPWPNLEAIKHMREDPKAQAALKAAQALCVSSSPGAYQLVRHVAPEESSK